MSRIQDIHRTAVATGINVNAIGEYDAMRGYTDFLVQFGMALSPEDVAIIEEIISDEKNHAIKLAAMACRYDGISPSPDDLKEALNELSVKAV